MVYVDVILPLALPTTLTYRLPQSWKEWHIGQRVVVPFVKKQAVGIIYKEHTQAIDHSFEIKEVTMALDDNPAVNSRQLALWEWIAEYYMCTLGEVMAAALPTKFADRTFALDQHQKLHINTSNYADETRDLSPLTEPQSIALNNILTQWQTHQTVLLFGVTSSGKTEVYTHLIAQTLQAGKQVLYLVPEIALTTQLTDRLNSYFGDKMFVYHSRITDTRRRDIYRQLLATTDAQLVVSARSGIFLPFNNLGLVIVDEEHEQSYKQADPAPRYHARSVAIILSRLHNAHTLLGTATPAVETWHNVKTGKYGMVRLTQRYQGMALPQLTLIDLNRQYHRKEMYGHFSDPLVARMKEELEAGKQVILFQNRRGYAPMLICEQCGQVPRCPDCDVPLTLHLSQRQLQCHYCGYTQLMLNSCPSCGGRLQIRGLGTERIEDEVAQLFPSARIERMDWDTTRRKDDYQHILDRFAEHQTDILIGTQMVTKGLHFDDVSLVGVLSADHLFNSPSYRCYERAYQMLEQVAGRAGRKGKAGEIIIQTWDVEHPVFKHLATHSYEQFISEQLQERQAYNFPPYYREITIIFKHNNEQKVVHTAHLCRERLVRVFGSRCSEVITPPLQRIGGQTHRHIHLLIEATASITQAKRLLNEQLKAVQELKDCRQVRIMQDVDPL